MIVGNALRGLLGAAGVAAIGFGLWHVLDFEPGRLVSAALWLAGAVLLHDLVFSPVVVLLGVLLTRVVPAVWRTAVVVAFVLWGSLTLIALPVLSRLGERPDNPSLLDRPYAAAWWGGTALVVLAVLASGLLARRRAMR